MGYGEYRPGAHRQTPAALQDIFGACERALDGAVSRAWIRGDVVRISRRGGTRVTLCDGVRQVDVWTKAHVLEAFQRCDARRGSLPAGWSPGELRIGDALLVQASAFPVSGQSQWSLRAERICRPDGDEAAVHGQLYYDFHALQLEGVISQHHQLDEMTTYRHDAELERRGDAPQVRKVVAISSRPSDGLIDFKKPLRWRRDASELRIEVEEKYVRLQGDGAPEEIAAAISSVASGADYVVVVRGGGNLAAFNSPVVARAIHASAVPVITALGHTANATLADFAAHASFDVPKDAGKALSRLHAAPYFRQKEADRAAEERRKQQEREARRREVEARRQATEDVIAALKQQLAHVQQDLKDARDAQQYWQGRAAALTTTRRQRVVKRLGMAGVLVAAVLLASVTTYAVDHVGANRTPSHKAKTDHKPKPHHESAGGLPRG